MRFKKIIKLFEEGNVCVTGLKGRGKDLLMSNVVVRRGLPYVANVDYGGDFHPFRLSDYDCGKNTYKDFLSGHVKYYKYPYPDGTDLYLSDCGIYFPSQYCNELNRDYKYFPVYMAISRHISDASVHFNVQNLNRCWDKLREMSDCYILCRRAFVLFGFAFQLVRIYDQYESCLKKIRPFSVRVPLICTRQTKVMVQMQRDQYLAAHGQIRNAILIYKHKSTYDTRFFKKLLEGGIKPCEDS